MRHRGSLCMAVGLGVAVALGAAPRALGQEGAGDAPAAATAPALAPLPVPATLTIEDAPNDDGKRFVVRWPSVEGATNAFEYEVQIAPTKEGPWHPVKRVFADTGLARDLDIDYGRAAAKLEGHGVIASPLAFYPSEHFLLAVVGPADVTKAREASADAAANPKALFAAFDAKSLVLSKARAESKPVEEAWARLAALAAAADDTSPAAEGEVEQLRTTLLDAMDGVCSRREALIARDLGETVVEGARKIFSALEIKLTHELEGHLRSGYFGSDERLARIVLDRTWYARLLTHATDPADKRTATCGVIAEGRAVENWFDWRKDNNFVLMLVVGGLVLIFIARARKNPDMYLRRIGGLDAVDEALGRATEMGKPVLFVHGLREMKDVSTIAAVNILGEISKHVARFDSRLLCATYDPIVLGVSQETVREGFTAAGRPDAYNEDDVFLAGADQFSYVAAIDGIMMRQRPAANFYCGYFYAESLVLAETGAMSGAIQIAATDSFTQLPFFVTTCDYTLMGEELYAASAYLSRDPLLLGSLKGQDYAKALMIVLLVGLTLLATLGFTGVAEVVKVY